MGIPLAVIAAVGSAEGEKSSGAIRNAEARVQAKQSELAATQREADRKNRLADALASQNASAGARNIAAFEGSPLTILNADIQREEQATKRDKFSSELSAFTQRARGSIAKRNARARTSLSLLQSGASFKEVSGN